MFSVDLESLFMDFILFLFMQYFSFDAGEAGLDSDQFGVFAIFFQQVIVSAGFDDFSVFDKNQTMGVAEGGEAVGDSDSGAIVDENIQGVLDFFLGFDIDGGSGFVQDEDGRILEDGAGDGKSLFFAAGKLETAFADNSIIAVFFLDDKFVSAGGASGGEDVGKFGLIIAVANIVENAAIE